tara:strand:+ start:4059 stop:5729 length:1671 start_codon:yes stop_codon:yes gene_type:complete
MTALLSKSKDASMRGFNKLTQSIFDVKTAVFGKKMPEKVSEAEEPSNNIVDFKVLNKPSSTLNTTSILVHKQALMEFKYERDRFGGLKIGKPSPIPKFASSPEMRKRLQLKKSKDSGIDFSSFRNMIDDLLKKIMQKVWFRIKRGIKRLIGKKGIKFIRSIKKIFRKIKINFKLFRRFAFKPFRQARRFVKSLPKKAWNLTKNIVKKGAMFVKKRFAKTAGKKLVKQSGKSMVKNVGKFLLKKLKVFYKAGPGKFITKIPIIGALVDFAINYFIFKESLGASVMKAVGAGLGTWIGGIIGTSVGTAAGSVVPIVGNLIGATAGGAIGSLLGGIVGDMLGGFLYKLITGGKGAKEGAKVKKPQFILVGEGGEDEWIVPKSRLGWWVAPLVGDIIEESVDKEQQENAKLKRETDKISEESVENVEQTTEESKTWKPGKIFNPVIQLSKLFDKKSTNIKEMMSIISSQERIIEQLKPADKPDSPINTPIQNPEPARTTLNNIDPDPEPDYAEVIPSLLQATNTTVISEEGQMLPFPIPVGVDGGSSAAYAVWGRKVVGN